ncbi:MAG TPA: hypothetical protein VD860_09725 [Azospirillum sp.]|nr:hypothetical protein [Azospirillum sp.]
MLHPSFPVIGRWHFFLDETKAVGKFDDRTQNPLLAAGSLGQVSGGTCRQTALPSFRFLLPQPIAKP